MFQVTWSDHLFAPTRENIFSYGNEIGIYFFVLSLSFLLLWRDIVFYFITNDLFGISTIISSIAIPWQPSFIVFCQLALLNAHLSFCVMPNRRNIRKKNRVIHPKHTRDKEMNKFPHSHEVQELTSCAIEHTENRQPVIDKTPPFFFDLS